MSTILLESLSQFGNSLINRPFDETDIHPQISAAAGMDIVTNTSVQQIFPFDVECKKGNSTTLEAAWRQAAARCPDHLRPIVVMEHDRKKPCVFGLYDDLTKFEVGPFLPAVAHLGMKEMYIRASDCLINRRMKRNPDSLYTEWYRDVYKSNQYDYHISINPLIEDYEDDHFLLTDFTLWLKKWANLLV